MKHKALPSDLKTGWLVLMGCRWMSLAVVLVFLLSNIHVEVPRHTVWLLLALGSIYTLALTAGRDFLPRVFSGSYAALAVDIMVCSSLLYFSGAKDSPFYLYTISPVLLAAFLRGGWTGFATGVVSVAAYIAGTLIQGQSLGSLLHYNGVDQLTAMVAYLMVAIFFSYPSGFLRQLQERNQELEVAQGSLAEVNKSLGSVNKQLVAVQSINAVLQSYLDLPMVIESILDGIKYGLDFDRVVIGLVDDGQTRIADWRLAGGRQEEQALWETFELAIGGDLSVRAFFDRQEPLVIDKGHDAPLVPPIYPDGSVAPSSYALSPLTVKSKPIGLILVDNFDSGRAIAAEDMTWLEVLSTHAAIAINNAQLYEKAQELAAITERNRIAMEIHDGLSQTLSGARLILNSCNRILPAAMEPVRIKLSYLDKMLARAYEEMRYALYNLRLPFLSVDSLSGFFRQHIGEFSHYSGIQAELAVSGPEDSQALSEDIKLCLCRVLQESLNNAHKHSGATSLTVFFNFYPERVILRIVDNGRGFVVEEALANANSGKTFGIVTTENRVRQLGGHFSIDSSPDLGTSVKVAMPYSIAAEVSLDKSARR